MIKDFHFRLINILLGSFAAESGTLQAAPEVACKAQAASGAAWHYTRRAYE